MEGVTLYMQFSPKRKDSTTRSKIKKMIYHKLRIISVSLTLIIAPRPVDRRFSVHACAPRTVQRCHTGVPPLARETLTHGLHVRTRTS